MPRQPRSLFVGLVALSLVGTIGATAWAQEPLHSDTATIELPATIPASIPSGELKTPFGPARWVHLQGDRETLPDILDPLPAPDGYVVLEEGGGGFGPCPEGDICQSYARLWFTPDLLEWTRRPLPTAADHGRLTLADGQYWFLAQDAHDDYEPPSIWRSSDTLEWQPIDLAGLTPPEPDLVEWRAQLGTLASSGDTHVLPVTFQAVGLRQLLGLEEPDGAGDLGWASLVDRGGGEYAAKGGYGEKLGTLRFEETDTGLAVIDSASGAELATLEGVGLDFIESWARPKDRGDTNGWSSVPVGHGIAVVEGDAVTMVETPEPTPGMRTGPILGTGDGFTLFGVQDDGTIGTWRSKDGLEWVEGDIVGDEPGEPFDVTWVDIWEGRLFAGGGRGGTWRDWTSSDGITWQEQVMPGIDAPFGRFGPRMVAFDEKGITFYEDGKRKGKRVEAEPMKLKGDTRGAGGYGVSVISPTTLGYSVFEEERQQGYRRDHWIVTFDRPPEGD